MKFILNTYIYIKFCVFSIYSSLKPPPSLHPVFFTYSLRFGLDSEQENGTLIRSEPKNGFRLRALVRTFNTRVMGVSLCILVIERK